MSTIYECNMCQKVAKPTYSIIPEGWRYITITSNPSFRANYHLCKDCSSKIGFTQDKSSSEDVMLDALREIIIEEIDNHED